MLRVGLTGDLGSGKSTVARMLADRGAVVLSSDEMGRAMMQPGQPVYTSIVKHFGDSVVASNGTLDRAKLATLAFDPHTPRVNELNAIVHPAVLAAQAEAIAAYAGTHKIVVVESALVFSAYGSTPEQLASRFDCILLITAPESAKIARFIHRMAAGRTLTAQEQTALETDARQRLSLQKTERFASECIVLHNDADVAKLSAQIDTLWPQLLQHEATL